MGILDEPVMLAGGLLSAYDAHTSGTRALATNEQLKSDILENLHARQRFSALENKKFNEQFQRELKGTTAEIDRRLSVRQAKVMREINKIGPQGRKDALRSFGKAAGRVRGDISARGLAGTSLSANASSALARGRSEALGEHTTGVAQLRSTAISGLTRDRVNALAVNRGKEHAAREAGHNRLTTQYLDALGDEANFLNTIRAPYPDQSPTEAFMAVFAGGGGGGGTVNNDELIATGVAAVTTVGSALITANAVATATATATATVGPTMLMMLPITPCLKGDTLIETDNGYREIKDIVEGDMVKATDSYFRKVIAVGGGDVPPEDREPYVKIMIASVPIVLTVSHPIGGKPAGEWKTGDEMAGVRVEVSPHEHVLGYDIALEGCDSYRAMGALHIHSVLGEVIKKIGMDKWLELKSVTQGV